MDGADGSDKGTLTAPPEPPARSLPARAGGAAAAGSHSAGETLSGRLAIVLEALPMRPGNATPGRNLPLLIQ